MSKRKILTLALTLCMVAILAVGGTLAYFTDTDYNKNVMTLGNVKIDQIEKDRNGEDFADDKVLYPVTADISGDVNEWIANEPNVVDKIVTVKNLGKTTAYVRTLFAFEAGDEEYEIAGTDLLGGEYIHFAYAGKNQIKFSTVQAANDGKDVYFTKDGTRYVVGVAYYPQSSATDTEGPKVSAIAAGAETDPSLKAVWLVSKAGNEFYDYAGDKYDILVLSQAVQTEGFATAEAAFDASFGELTQENIEKWFTDYTTSKLESADPT